MCFEEREIESEVDWEFRQVDKYIEREAIMKDAAESTIDY